MSRRAAAVSDSLVTRTLSQLSDSNAVRISIDLVPAVRRNVAFLRTVAESPWLHETAAAAEAVRRYDELWMPLACEMAAGTAAPMILPPIDIEWVWFCHTLNPESYWDYCDARFSKLIPKAAIFNEENEEYALLRCKEIWSERYPSEPFENEADSNSPNPSSNKNEWLVSQVMKNICLYSKFSQPYMIETMYLIAANQRYKGFVHILGKLSDWNSRFVPAVDILLMWITHQSYPTIYADDLRSMEHEAGNKVRRPWETAEEDEIIATKKLWERTFDQPYEKVGGHIVLTREGIGSEEPMVYWEVFDSDVNTKYKSLAPRFLLEVSVFVRLKSRMNLIAEEIRREFLRLGVTRCHRELKIDIPVETIPHDSWKEACHLYCEFVTRGISLELRRHGGSNCIFGGSVVKNTVAFLWNDLLRAPTLTLGKEIEHGIEIVASITPPAQASYLLKSVPDRVTDDSGAMVSDVILRMNNYRPQEGRWLSRTVLDHSGRECFVVRMRIGEGFWRRGGEAPSVVKWEDRITEIREGSWSYVAGSIGRAPVKVVGTATPKQPVDPWNTAWKFSTGDELMLAWQSSNSSPSFCLTNQTSSDDSSVKLLRGRRMQYRVRKSNKDDDVDREDDDVEGADFVTLVRYTDENPTGRATALINWKLQVVDFIPEEDAVLVLLLCVSILRSVFYIRKEDVGNLLTRRRLKEAKLGEREWGSVILHRSVDSSSINSFVKPWHWNAKIVTGADGLETFTKQPGMSYSPAEGGDGLYRRGLIRS